MKSIHNYHQYRCNPNLRYGRLRGIKLRIGSNARYMIRTYVISHKVRHYPFFLKNMGYMINDNQYQMGNI